MRKAHLPRVITYVIIATNEKMFNLFKMEKTEKALKTSNIFQLFIKKTKQYITLLKQRDFNYNSETDKDLNKYLFSFYEYKKIIKNTFKTFL